MQQVTNSFLVAPAGAVPSTGPQELSNQLLSGLPPAGAVPGAGLQGLSNQLLSGLPLAGAFRVQAYTG